jgi:hypothetical protein
MKRLFKSSIKTCNFGFPNGKVANFRFGMYATADEYEIQQLEKEIAAGHPNIYIDPEAKTLTAEQENPMLALKKKIIEEYLADQAKFVNPENDMGTTETPKLNPVSTTGIAAVALGSGPTSMMAKLAALKSPAA